MKVQTQDGTEFHVNPNCIMTAHDDGGDHLITFVDGSTEVVDKNSFDRIVAWMDRIPHA